MNNKVETKPLCDDCESEITITLEAYGSGLMAVISCPNCGISYDTNLDPAELDPELVREAGKIAGNGELVKQRGNDNRFTNDLGRYGYTVRMSGAYVCYSCGHLCECGEGEE